MEVRMISDPTPYDTKEDEKADRVRIILPGYRASYLASDFTDPAARSLDEEVADFLSTRTNRAPWGSPKSLLFQMAVSERDPQKERITAEAYRNMFKLRGQAAIRQLVREIPLAVTLITIGAGILWVSNRLADANLSEDLKQTLSDLVQVGAWVALWSAISLLFGTGYHALYKYIAFRRLASIPIEYEYKERGTLKHQQRELKTA
jgi:hypothetical protein